MHFITFVTVARFSVNLQVTFLGAADDLYDFRVLPRTSQRTAKASRTIIKLKSIQNPNEVKLKSNRNEHEIIMHEIQLELKQNPNQSKSNLSQIRICCLHFMLFIQYKYFISKLTNCNAANTNCFLLHTYQAYNL